MGANSQSKTVTKCRVCGKSELKTYLDLGEMPLANNLFDTKKEAIDAPRYKLKVQLCGNCGLSQLSEVIEPRILFSKYAYRSSMSQTYVNHCRNMAKDFKDKYGPWPGTSGDLVIDIAGNDGTLLKQFKEEIGHIRVLNIDPAANLTEISRANGIPAHTEFFNINSAMSVLSTHGKAQVITATNVFAHVDDIRGFLLAAKFILQHNGIIALEFPYLIPYIEGLEYGTTYHEHLSYVAISPLKQLCDETGLKIIAVEPQNIHCGTVRVIIGHDYSNREVETSVNEFIENEIRNGYDKFEKYNYWAAAVNNSVEKISYGIRELKWKKNKIFALGASAKGNTLLNLCEFTADEIDCILDETPEKIGMYSPGTGIPIVSLNKLENVHPDYILICAWNFKNELMEKCRKIGYRGKFIVPIPHFEIID